VRATLSYGAFGRLRDRGIVWLVAGLAFAFSCQLANAQDCTRNMLTIAGPESYVATPDVQALHLTHGFTIECWAKVNTFVRLSAIVDKGSPARNCYGIFLSTDSTLFGFVRGNRNAFDTSAAVDTIANWHHYAFVFTPGDSLRFYVDSELQSSQYISFNSIDSSTDSLRIGISANGNVFLGSIDELRIWNIPRSLAQIRQTLFHTLPGTDSGLVLYYSFDDPAATARVHDFSGHGRDGFVCGQNAEILPSSSPILNSSPGYRLSALETNIVIPTRRCIASFDTVVHVRNLGSTPLFIDTAGFSNGQAFSIIPNSPFWLPADSSKIDSLRLHFQPHSGGVFYDSLYISSSSDCGGKVRIGLEATYDSVGLSESTDTLRFGPLTECSLPARQTITLKNTSSTDSVWVLSAIPPAGSGLTVLHSFPFALAPSQSVQITIQLSSGPRGPLTASIPFELDKCAFRDVMVNVSADRQQDALSMPPTIDFGSAENALGGVTRDTIIVVTNTGDVPTAISKMQAGPSGLIEILDARNGIYKAPGDTLQVRVRMHATDCGIQTAKINIQTSRCLVDTSTFLTINLFSPEPLAAPSVDWGSVCSLKDSTIFLSNPNGQPVTLDSITYSSNFVFSGTILQDTVPANASLPIPFEFNASRNGEYADTVYFHTSPCGTASAVFRGAWGYAGLSFTGPTLLFGRGCKTDPVRETTTLTNNSSRTVTLANNTYHGSLAFLFDTFTFPIVLAPGASKTFSVLYTPSLNILDSGTFSLLSSDGCVAASLQLRGSREIAKGNWSTPSGEFGTVCPGDTETIALDLQDRGIDSIDVLNTAISGSAFTLVQRPSSFGKDGIFDVRFVPQTEQDDSGTLSIVVDSCGTAFSIPLHGSGGPMPQMIAIDSSYDFGNVPVGDSEDYCFEVLNPSCTPLSLRVDTSVLNGAFRTVGASGPKTVRRGDTVFFCIQFKPSTYGERSSTLTLLADSGLTRTIALQGNGIAADVSVSPTVLDFGYVLRNTSSTLAAIDTNKGNAGTPITVSHDAATPFSVSTHDSLSAQSSDSVRVIFSPLTTGTFQDTLYLHWMGRTDSVILRGVGIESGLQVSAVGLDFGNVHIGHDSTRTIDLFALSGVPTIDSVHIRSVSPAPFDTFSYASDAILPHSIANGHDTVKLTVTYQARLEQSDTGELVLYSGADSISVPLVGRGVEAHPWISPDSIPFPAIVLGSSFQCEPVQIRNLGEYPLYINSIAISNPVFSASPIAPNEPILPGDTLFDTVTFTPARARQVTGTLAFHTSYRDSVLSVALSGTGIYPAGTGPSFGYTVASITTEPGEIDTIPVSISGVRLSMIDADSLVLDFHFDPEMVRMLGADAGQKQVPVSRFTRLNDHTVEVAVPMTSFTSGTVLRLYTEALLGPTPLSYITVAGVPIATQAASNGAFSEVDCSGPLHGVTLAGPYGVNAIVPNPTPDRARLPFTLGLDGPVTIVFYNSIGEVVKQVDAGTGTAGAHTLQLDLSDLPPGRYVYRLSSLDYHAEGAVVILR